MILLMITLKLRMTNYKLFEGELLVISVAFHHGLKAQGNKDL